MVEKWLYHSLGSSELLSLLSLFDHNILKSNNTEPSTVTSISKRRDRGKDEDTGTGVLPLAKEDEVGGRWARELSQW